MTGRADQQICINAPAHSTAIGQAFFWQNIPSPRSVSTPTSQIWIPVTYVFPKAKIAIEREEISECDGHTVHKLSHRHLTAYLLAPWESDCSRTHRKVSSDWLPSYIKATWPFLMVFSVAGYFPDRPCIFLLQFSGCGLTSLTLCSLLAGYLCFGRSCCLFHQLWCYWCGNLVSLRTKSTREMASKVFHLSWGYDLSSSCTLVVYHDKILMLFAFILKMAVFLWNWNIHVEDFTVSQPRRTLLSYSVLFLLPWRLRRVIILFAVEGTVLYFDLWHCL